VTRDYEPPAAPEWARGMGLTWSGKWHVITKRFEGKSFARAHCGSDVYAHHRNVPNYVGRLQGISKGHREGPVCKKCDSYLRSTIGRATSDRP
jgi:hypothetical protein